MCIDKYHIVYTCLDCVAFIANLGHPLEQIGLGLTLPDDLGTDLVIEGLAFQVLNWHVVGTSFFEIAFIRSTTATVLLNDAAFVHL